VSLSKNPFRAFHQFFAVCCAHNLFAIGEQIPHLQPEKYFLPGTRPGRKCFSLYFPLARKTLRGFFDSLTTPCRKVRGCVSINQTISTGLTTQWCFDYRPTNRRVLLRAKSRPSVGCALHRPAGLVPAGADSLNLPCGLPLLRQPRWNAVRCIRRSGCRRYQTEIPGGFPFPQRWWHPQHCLYRRH